MREMKPEVILSKGSESVTVEAGSEAEAYWTEQGFSPVSEAKAEAKREEKIAVAIQSLKPKDAAAWNQDGTPKVSAVREAGGEDLSDVSSEEVHAVWATFK